METEAPLKCYMLTQLTTTRDFDGNNSTDSRKVYQIINHTYAYIVIINVIPTLFVKEAEARDVFEARAANRSQLFFDLTCLYTTTFTSSGVFFIGRRLV